MFLSLATALLLATRLEFVVPDANFSLREGLPAVQVQSLYQDRYGALWVGTSAGLAQLGGPTIQVFGPEAGLARSTILAIAEEPTGAIVVGTATGTFRQVHDRFEPAGLPAAAAQLPVRRFIRGRDGTLWALAGERIVLRHFAGQWNAVGIDGALAFEATDFAVDDSGALWLATRNHGVLRLVSEGTRFRKSMQFQPASESLVAIDHVATLRDRVYFTSARGLSMVSVSAGGVVETIPFPPGAMTGRRALSISATGEVFVGTNAGVFMLSGRSLVPVGSRNDRARAAVGSLLSDREGQLWVGTLDSGLNLLLRGRGVMFVRADKESFRSIDIDRTGVHWVSNERRVLHFKTDDGGNPLPAGEARFDGFDALTISGIAEDPSGGLLFALEGGVGLLSRSARASGAMVVQHDPRFDALRDRQVVSLHRDARDALWAVSPFGIYRLQSGAREAAIVPLEGVNPSMAALDPQGLLWVATRQGALFQIDTGNVGVSAVPLPPRRRVESVGPAPDRGVVVTFENGRSAFLSTTDGAARVATTLAPRELSGLSVASLQRVGDSFLVAHGGDRLSQVRLNPAVVEQTLLTSADLEDADFRYLSLREGRAGRMWFTLLNGIGRFDPPNAPPEPSRLRLDIETQSVTLGPRPNSVDLHAQLSDPVAPRKARYRYRLAGQSEEFSDWSSDTHIPLSNVPPGVYKLEVEAEDRYGRRARPVSLEVVAQAHPWESWTFRVGALILALGAAYSLYQRRVRAIEQDRLDLAAAVQAGRMDLEIANKRLQELSLTDMLTGLRNRRYYAEVVEDELRLLKRRYDDRAKDGDPNRDAVFFLLDLDRFKTVNDLFGHAGGDAVLKTTALRLESLLRRTDRLIRWGGEEFLVISLDCRRAEAGEIAARILDAISAEPYPIGPEGGIRITTSIGWAAYPFSIDGTAAQAEDVVRLADRGLYRAKRAGRNCAVGVSPAGQGEEHSGAPLGAVEVPEELGYPVIFTTVKGQQRDGLSLENLRGSGPAPRLP